MWHVWRRKKMRTSVMVEKPEGKSHSEDLGVDGRIILNILK
jgi:UTP-glucose-1-phosphate uridylyltransferase